MSFDLHQFERWMLTVVSHPDGVSGGLQAAEDIMPVAESTLANHVNPSKNRTAAQRLGVYANMYFWRLVDVLAEDFEAVQYALGEHDFYHKMVEYLTEHPSRNYRLSPLGKHLPGWLLRQEIEHREFLSELAALERFKEEVFNDPRSETLSTDQLAGIPPDEWAAARLATIPAFRLLAAQHPVNAFFQAVMDGDEPEIPAAEPQYVVIWRHELTVWRLTITREHHCILSVLHDGGTLGDALEACLELDGVEPDTLLSEVGGWFSSWTADGMFSAVEF